LTIELFNKLDIFCEEQGMFEVRQPLLIKGESGTGKSALLSNWLQRR
jgi:transcriptional regulator of aromatic amino acid metabolism